MTKKRLTAFLLALCMMLSLLPDVGWAADPDPINDDDYYRVYSLSIGNLKVEGQKTDQLVVLGKVLNNENVKTTDPITEYTQPDPAKPIKDLDFIEADYTLQLTPHQEITVKNSNPDKIAVVNVNSDSKVTLENMTLEELNVAGNANTIVTKGTFDKITVADAATAVIGGTKNSDVTIKDKVTISGKGANVTLQNISSATATVDVTANATVVLNNVTLNGERLTSAPLKISCPKGSPDVNGFFGAQITLDGVTLGNTGDFFDFPALEIASEAGDAGATITLKGNNNKLQGGIGRAGLECAGSNSVIIRGSGSLNATGGRGGTSVSISSTVYGGAGIGGRSASATVSEDLTKAGNITIKGACTVTATGIDGGAAIGNGADNTNSSLGTISFISEKLAGSSEFYPVVIATTKAGDVCKAGATVGRGGSSDPSVETVEPTDTEMESWKGLVITDKKAVLNNDMTLYQSPVNLNVPLTIKKGCTLTIGYAEKFREEGPYNGLLNIGSDVLVTANGIDGTKTSQIRIDSKNTGVGINNKGTIYVDNKDSFVKVAIATDGKEPEETPITSGYGTVIYNKYEIPFDPNGGEYKDPKPDGWDDETSTVTVEVERDTTETDPEKFFWEIVDSAKIPKSEDFKEFKTADGHTQEFIDWYWTDAKGNKNYLKLKVGDEEPKSEYDTDDIKELVKNGFKAEWSKDSVILTLDPDVSAGGSLKRTTTAFPDTNNYKFDTATEKFTVNMQGLDYERNEDDTDYKSKDENGNPTGTKGKTTSLKALLDSYFTGPESKNGKFFLGWRNDTTREIVDDEKAIFYDKDTTFTAQWTTGYKIYFDVNGGQFVDDKGEPVGEKPEVKDGYTSENFNLTATQLEAAGIKNDPKRDHYTFEGWFRYKGWDWSDKDKKDGPDKPIDDKMLEEKALEAKTISPDEILYAKWHDGYKITFELGDGASFRNPDKYKDFYTDVSTDKVKDPLPTNDNVNRSGYILTGWEYVESTDADGNETRKDATNDTKFEGPTTLFAKWQKQKVEITLDLVKNITDVKLPTNNKVVLNVTTPVGTSNTLGDQYPQVKSNQATFDGWYLDPDKDDRPVRPDDPAFTDDTTIYAHWKAPYQITFDPNGGTLTGENTMMTGDGGILEKLPAAPTHKTSSFTAWVTTVRDETTGKDVEVEVTAGEEGTVFDGPTTVTAKWGAPYYIIYENSEGRYTLDEDSVPHWTNDDGTLPELPTPMPTTKGDLFDGWFTDPDCKIPADSQFVATKGPVTLYAKWAITYDITLDANMGTINGKDKIVVKTDRDGKIPDIDTYIPIRDQSEFKGWYTRDEHGNEAQQVTKDYQFK
ncbi:MAG: InlB B-repeat-containing protein, partial [Oscillospiraceae bacterium]|nr:InlB B-repeat-containing protein [Oscillospiraceae bacterium]